MQVSRISARPPQPAIAAGSNGSRRHCCIDSATSPPAASSQARVGSEKNAQDGDVWVHNTAAASDAAPTNARTTAYGMRRIASRTRAARGRRTSHAVPMINTGHTR